MVPKLKKEKNSTKVVKAKKKTTKKSIVKKTDAIDVKAKVKTKVNYIFSVGRRKSAIARVRYFKKGEGKIIVNQKDYKIYFPYFEHQKIITDPLNILESTKQGNFTIRVNGGGIKGQAESIRLGISRILLQIDQNIRPSLKTGKFLTRDPRVKERKKYGLRKARRAPQWQKR